MHEGHSEPSQALQDEFFVRACVREGEHLTEIQIVIVQ